MRRDHRPVPRYENAVEATEPDVCDIDGAEWPCETDRLLADIDRLGEALRVLVHDLPEAVPLQPPKTLHHVRYAEHWNEARHLLDQMGLGE